MSLQLGETFSGFKVQRQLLTETSLMCPPDLKRSVFKYNELAKIFVPPPPPSLVSKGLLRLYGYWGYSESFFKPSVSLTEKNLSHVFTRLKIHHHISIKLYLFNNVYQLNRNISI